ncbi:MAG TPA: hypothetical protein VHR38_04095 [Solirubrobacterales bacterium]|nr:hypothetical protein [Solirubrobacterales bacterium]
MEAHFARVKTGLAEIFLGDWHPVLRDPLDLFRLSFVVGAVIFALQGDWDAAVRLFLPAVAVLAVRALNIPRPIDWCSTSPCSFRGWATHFISSASSGGTTTPSTSPCR